METKNFGKIGVFLQKNWKIPGPRQFDRINVDKLPENMHDTLSTFSKSVAFVEKLAGSAGNRVNYVLWIRSVK